MFNYTTQNREFPTNMIYTYRFKKGELYDHSIDWPILDPFHITMSKTTMPLQSLFSCLTPSLLCIRGIFINKK